MNNDHHSISHGPSLPKEISPWYDSRSLSWPPSPVGGKSPPPCFSLPLFIVVSFFLNRVPKVGTCPISLSLQLLGVVVSTEKYKSVRHEALNTIVTAFPLDVFILSVVFSYFIAFPILWNNIECCHWSHTASFILGHVHPRRILHGRGGIFPWVGPLAQCRQRYRPISLLPLTIAPQNPTIRLLGRIGGFWWHRACVTVSQALHCINARVFSFTRGASLAVRYSFSLSKPHPCRFGTRCAL